MRLTKHTDFALRALMYLAKQPKGARVLAQEIADSYDIPHNHLTKIIHKLSQLGYINTYRGRSGGVELAKSKEQTLIRQLIIDFEPSLNLADCEHCLLSDSCKLERVLNEGSKAFLESIGNKSLQDIS